MTTTTTDPASHSTVEFFFDPACPWTWITSRWLVDVAGQTGIDVQWHALSLGLLNAGSIEPTDEIPEKFRAGMATSAKALRIVERLAADRRNDDAGCFYTAFGTAMHVDGTEPGDDLLRGALGKAGLEEELASSGDDHDLDAAVTASHERSQSLVSGESGSPVISVDGSATFGPIVSPAPTGPDAMKLWEALRTLLSMPAFYELKRNRTGASDVS